MEDIQSRLNKSLDDSRKIIDDIERKNKERKEKMIAQLERTERLSMENFSSWRDYLHKYFSTILALSAATGFLQNESFDLLYFRLGLYLSLSGVFLGYITINVYLYIERRWLRVQDMMSFEDIYKQFEHPDKKTTDFIEGLKLHTRDYIIKCVQDLKVAKHQNNKEQAKFLKSVIQKNKRLSRSFSFIGQHFELIERIWMFGVTISLGLSMVGLFLMYTNIAIDTTTELNTNKASQEVESTIIEDTKKDTENMCAL
jgi:hypothetical protein